MTTKVAALGFFRRLWQKLFRRVEDAYGFQQPPAAAGPAASPTRNNGLVEAVDISAPASLDPLRGLGGKCGQQHESSSPAEPAETSATSCSVDTTFAAAARAATLRPLLEMKSGSLNSGTCPVVPFYSVNTDPLDLQLVAADGGPEGSERRDSSGGGIAALVAGFDAAAEKAWNDDSCSANMVWQRPLFWGETTAEHRPQRRVMGMAVRLDPAIVCDLDSGPFDRPCCESVFYTEVSNK